MPTPSAMTVLTSCAAHRLAIRRANRKRSNRKDFTNRASARQWPYLQSEMVQRIGAARLPNCTQEATCRSVRCRSTRTAFEVPRRNFDHVEPWSGEVARHPALQLPNRPGDRRRTLRDLSSRIPISMSRKSPLHCVPDLSIDFSPEGRHREDQLRGTDPHLLTTIDERFGLTADRHN